MIKNTCFSSGSCRLLCSFDNNVLSNKYIESIHYVGLGFTYGKNFIGKLHTPMQHLYFLKYINGEIDIMQEQICNLFNSNKYLYNNNYGKFEESLKNVRSNIGNTKIFIFEICSTKFVNGKNNNFPCQIELVNEQIANIYNNNELFENSLTELIDYINNKYANALIILVGHIRNWIINNNHPYLAERELIYNLIVKSQNNYSNVKFVDPVTFITQNDLNDDTHYNNQGYYKLHTHITQLIHKHYKIIDLNFQFVGQSFNSIIQHSFLNKYAFISLPSYANFERSDKWMYELVKTHNDYDTLCKNKISFIFVEGKDKWYINSNQCNYEDYIKFLIKFIKNILLIDNIYTIGFSMGGYGAIKNYVNNTNDILSAFSISGALNIKQYFNNNMYNLKNITDNIEMYDILPNNNKISLLCGEQDIFFMDNVNFVEKYKSTNKLYYNYIKGEHNDTFLKTNFPMSVLAQLLLSKYLFIPIGTQCNTSYLLKKHGLRKKSYPFDYMFSNLKYAYDIIKKYFIK